MVSEMKFKPCQKKPVEVEFAGPFDNLTTIETLEGDFEVDEDYLDKHGSYVIIRGVNGELYPCATDIFEDTYEVIDND